MYALTNSFKCRVNMPALSHAQLNNILFNYEVCARKPVLAFDFFRRHFMRLYDIDSNSSFFTNHPSFLLQITAVWVLRSCWLNLDTLTPHGANVVFFLISHPYIERDLTFWDFWFSASAHPQLENLFNHDRTTMYSRNLYFFCVFALW